MGIVRFALRFPHTFYVLAALILFLGVAAIRSMPTDIFPEIRIPVVTVIGNTPPHHVGDGTTRHHLQPIFPSAPTSTASRTWKRRPSTACRSRRSTFSRRRQPRPRHRANRVGDKRHSCPDAARHPAADCRGSSTRRACLCCSQSQLDSLNEQQLYDFGIYRVRQQLAPVPGVTLPTPAGGKYRQDHGGSTRQAAVPD